MAWIIRGYFLFLMANGYALLLDSHFKENLEIRYGVEIVDQFLLDPRNKAEAKTIMNQIEEQFADVLEIQLYASIPNQELLTRCQALKNSQVRCKFAFELHKCLTLSEEIPSLAKSSYKKEQLQFLKMMIKILELDQTASWENYPSDPHNQSIHYIYEGGKPIALFKPAQFERDNEIAFWELSFLLGIEKVSVPVASAYFQNNLGVLHRYIQNDVVGNKAFNLGVNAWVTRESFLQASLAVLAFGLRDIHSSNMAYTLSDNGYFAIRLYDTTLAFMRNDFSTDFRGGYRRIHTPFAWAGWDFPQAGLPLSKKEQKEIANLLSRWSTEDLIAYVKHPLTNIILTEMELSQFIERIEKLKNYIKGTAPEDWLTFLCPKTPAVRNKIKYFFPDRDISYVLFQNLWNPDLVRTWLAPNKQAEFEQWLANFQ